jgi:hypothetical protein
MRNLYTKFLALSKPIRIISYTIAILLAFFALIVLFVSPITEYVVEKNSEAWIGRKITMDDLTINLLNGKITVDEFKLYENSNDTVFVGFKQLYINIALYKAITGKY